MNLTAQQKRICEQVVNVFETGSTDGDYSNISIYNDGPNDIRQITYGRSQTTEYGNLDELVDLYASRNGLFSDKLHLGSVSSHWLTTRILNNCSATRAKTIPLCARCRTSFSTKCIFNGLCGGPMTTGSCGPSRLW